MVSEDTVHTQPWTDSRSLECELKGVGESAPSQKLPHIHQLDGPVYSVWYVLFV